SKSIRFEAQLDPAVPDMEIDYHKLHQVFLNIGKNAIEAMGHKGRLTVATHYHPADQTASIRFATTAVGIPPGNLEKVFDLFFSSKGEKGNGIGLAVAKQFVLAHGGQIWAESTVGQGSTFTIRLNTQEHAKG